MDRSLIFVKPEIDVIDLEPRNGKPWHVRIYYFLVCVCGPGRLSLFDSLAMRHECKVRILAKINVGVS